MVVSMNDSEELVPMNSSEELLPPENLLFEVSRADFKPTGERWLGIFKELCDLKPHESVLDIGCGIGRMAVTLAEYLSADARYEGLDVARAQIEWARDHITPRHPSFRFHRADVFNKSANPTGTTQPTDYTFPYGNGEFDFAFLLSVFTHMLPEDVERYFEEIARVLKTGGRFLATVLLLNDESLALLAATAGQRRDPSGSASRALFSHDFGHYRVTSSEVPEIVIAYQENYLLDLCDKHGFRLNGAVEYGRWPGRSKGRTGQDLIVAEKV
jgi:SAM-dependent methyltransferase